MDPVVSLLIASLRKQVHIVIDSETLLRHHLTINFYPGRISLRCPLIQKHHDTLSRLNKTLVTFFKLSPLKNGQKIRAVSASKPRAPQYFVYQNWAQSGMSFESCKQSKIWWSQFDLNAMNRTDILLVCLEGVLNNRDESMTQTSQVWFLQHNGPRLVYAAIVIDKKQNGFSMSSRKLTVRTPERTYWKQRRDCLCFYSKREKEKRKFCKTTRIPTWKNCKVTNRMRV